MINFKKYPDEIPLEDQRLYLFADTDSEWSAYTFTVYYKGGKFYMAMNNKEFPIYEVYWLYIKDVLNVIKK